MITTIASLLHLHAIEDAVSARRLIQDGHALVCEDDVKAVVVKLRAEYDALRAERDALKAQVEATRALCRDQLDHGEGEADLAQDVLDAMDEAAR